MVKYTEAERQWLINFIPGHSTEETAAAFDQEFHKKITYNQVRSFRKNNKLKCGVNTRFVKGHSSWNKGRKMTEEEKAKIKETMFKKGFKPHNTLPVGSIIYTKGYWKIKIAEPKKWIPYPRYVYEKAYGPLSADMLIIHLDSNEDNNKLENLAAVTKAELCRLNYEHLISSDPEITKAGILKVRLDYKITERTKRHCRFCKWYEQSNEKNHFYCNNPKYVRDKKYSLAYRCLGYEVGN